LALAHHPERPDPTKALAYARLAVARTRGESANCLATLAEVEERAGDLQGAVGTLGKVLALPAASPELQLALDRCRRALFLRSPSYASLDGMLEAGTEVLLIRADDDWRFLLADREPAGGLEWTRPDFAGGGWKERRGGFGYGLERHHRTWLKNMSSGESDSAVYLRRAFEVPNPQAIQELSLYVWADGDFVAYLNGEKLERERAEPAGDQPGGEGWGHMEPLSSLSDPPPERLRVDAARLRSGVNCIALKGWNPGDKHLSFLLNGLLAGKAAPDLLGARRRLESRGESRLLRYLEARVLQRGSKHAEAAAKLKELLAQDPASPELRLRYAESLRALGDAGAAER
jgi:hypothetical protein